MTPADLAKEAADALATRTGIHRHAIAVTLGSGWKTAADHIGETVAEIPANEIPGFTASGIPGHSGTLRSVRAQNGEHVLVIGARTHYYEGKGVAAVVHGVRTAAAAGAHTMVLTNGAGGLKPTWTPGQPVLISDHINLTGTSPIIGANFIDLTDLYTNKLRAIARQVAPDLDEGVYTQLSGPHYETPAEVRMVRAIGGDIVGMSTALEAIAAREAGLDVLGLSLITNLAAGLQEGALNHQEVLEAGHAAEQRLGPLLAEIITGILNEEQA
ncbi:purine-nucleoside phosphorylase [Arthrobacter sp. B2a2-09]|uniref:purine-nucleoside phosphorylase n=1 Tax=Arthrobacter sp. B2a2-09 TaxID=2952822 RepID=UPI0022CD3755|nr:purine-nucleoside phosphorylase [Arthrobacter sp. B2a2-09]MCZ9884924.1 purine-nucleoside phosphorylase [Arthrobacter sp. B2a2-09]